MRGGGSSCSTEVTFNRLVQVIRVVQVAQAFSDVGGVTDHMHGAGRGSGRRSTRPARGRARSSRSAAAATTAPAPASTPGGTETAAPRRCRPRPNSCRTRSVSGPSPPRRDATPGHPEYLLPGTLEQRVVDRDSQRRSDRQEVGHDQIGQRQSHRVARPASQGEESVRAAVMPQLLQTGSDQHSTHRSTASLSDQTNNQPDERREGRSGKARPEHGQRPANEDGTVAPGSIDGSLSRGWCRNRRCFPLHPPRSRTSPSPARRHDLRGLAAPRKTAKHES